MTVKVYIENVLSREETTAIAEMLNDMHNSSLIRYVPCTGNAAQFGLCFVGVLDRPYSVEELNNFLKEQKL